ncbi:dethiobiotin synthase [Syntrophus aciditrophicus]|uniref:ATP-dependent dethiobiotin synthetase BioD n=1 Tax=Syntrophus aciditrophicus (strain SB) TaxID=56780 RepID=Q2LY95_SYNAS|nr:dethiobiotin synthase [Syntrophus aciditrophicus]ABC76084.1 dethiobiotin synthetase [Syntrophus aciditrophicus SB]OPY17910.1 MAG: ATP-dependent dethiobiotin synthetase BioD [Syntrophus sp. PtaB.Bin075]
MKTEIPDIYVIGTDTGVGKTVLSFLLMRYFFDRGAVPFYFKPVQTGCRHPYDTDSDAKFIYENIPELSGKDPACSVGFCYRNPKAPFFAARNEGRQVDWQRILETLDEKRARFAPLIVEAAGGVFVPIDGEKLVIDTIPPTGARPLIAARAGLGTINHTLLTIAALEQRNIEPLGVILLDGGEVETPRDMILENIEAIERHSGLRVAGVVGRIADFQHLPADCFKGLQILFEGRMGEHQ